MFYKWVCFPPLRATWVGWKRKEFPMTWEEKTRLSLETSIRFTTGTKSMLAVFFQLTCPINFAAKKTFLKLYYLPWHEGRRQKTQDSQYHVLLQEKSCVPLLIGSQFFPGRAWEVFGGSWQAGSFIRQTGEKPINFFCIMFLCYRVYYQVHFTFYWI